MEVNILFHIIMRFSLSLFAPLALFSAVRLSLIGAEVDDAAASAEVTERRAAALAAVRARDGDAAEARLRGQGRVAVDPAGQLELATDLLRVAFDARALGDLPAAQLAATRALRLVERAERHWAKEPSRLAELQLFRATLMEEFIGSSDDAILLAKRAHALDPQNPEAARRAGILAPPPK